MNKYKKRLVIFLVIQAVITIIHKFYGIHGVEDWYRITNWSYWLAMGWGSFIIFYAFKIRCIHCHSGQVFRGFSAFDIRWPQDRCYKCGEAID